MAHPDRAPSAFTQKEMWVHTAAWGNLENAYKAKAPLAKGQIVHFCFFEARRVATFREREVRMAVAKAGGGAQCLWAGLYLGRWRVLKKVGGWVGGCVGAEQCECTY